jgi:hypothetical protein
LIPEQKEHGGMNRGKELEKEALRLVNFNGPKFSPAVVESEEYPFMIASLDGLSFDGKIACEIKCLNLNDHDNEYVPAHYMPQLQHQMYCCDLQQIIYVGYHPNSQKPLYTIEVKRDEEFLADYLPRAKVFWDCIQTFTAPELTEKDYRNFSEIPDYREAEAAYIYICNKLEKLEEKKEQVRTKMIEMSQGNNVNGAYTKLTNYVRKGPIAYEKIAVLKEIDLEQYRKPMVKSVKITKV